MQRITWKDIFRQLKADLIGKDSYRGITLTYGWMANQFGHFSLGYIPTLICYTLLVKHTTLSHPSLRAAVYISVFWLLFELYNFLGPLLLQKHSASKLLFIAGNKYTFLPAWGNVAFDTFTDLCFFWLGAFAASLFLEFTPVAVIIVSCAGLIVLYPSYYWYRTKMYQQCAQYPFQFRLSQWDAEISDTDKETVNKFVRNKTTGNHLLIFGGRRSGKTSLGVAIGAEASIKHATCLYTTGMKLYTMFFERHEKLLNSNTAWNWRTASLMIIDDINPGEPVPVDLVTPEAFLNMVDASSPVEEENRRILREKNLIWILGKENAQSNSTLTWKQMMEKLGVQPDKITFITLLDSFLP